MPAAFAFAMEVLDDPTAAVFAAFGSFATLLLVDFAGPMRRRIQAQLALAVAGAVLITLGTLVSGVTWLSVLATAIVGFGVLFSGVVSSVLAGATTSLLLVFVLPVSLRGPLSSVPDRLLGWGIASAAALLAIRFLWPAPARDPFRGSVVAACRALAGALRDGGAEVATAAVQTVHSAFFATPFRPTGLSTATRAIVRLVDELQWLELAVAGVQRPQADPAARAVDIASASVLECCAALIDGSRRSTDGLDEALSALSDAVVALETSAIRQDGLTTSASALNPCFRAQEASFAVSQIASNVELAVAAERRGWLDAVLGRQPAGAPGPLAAAEERAGAHLDRHSTWLRNSLRGALALAGAVLVADLTGAENKFWVVFGTLSVLRSSALSTGQSVVRALMGTVAGLIVGAGIIVAIGTNTTLYWLLLPPAVLIAGVAPAAISFAAGQAAFTVTVLVLFNLLAPAGLRTGVIRIEDVVLGCAVSLGVGVLLWPRGAAEVLGTALAEAYRDTAAYLAETIRRGLDGAAPTTAPTAEALRAAGASRRLDDTFRGYLSERGAKPVPLADVTRLVTGVVGLRLAADAVSDLWSRGGPPDHGDGVARAELLADSGRMTVWFGAFAASLTGVGEVPGPDGDEDRPPGASVRTMWTADHLDAVRRLQASLVEPARAVTGRH